MGPDTGSLWRSLTARHCGWLLPQAALLCAAPEPDGLKHEQPRLTQEVTSVSLTFDTAQVSVA